MAGNSSLFSKCRHAFTQFLAVQPGKRGAFVADKARRAIWSRGKDRRLVFKFEPHPLPIAQDRGISIKRYDSLDEVPLEAFEPGGGFMPRSWFADRFQEGAHLWTLWTGKGFQTCLWVIRGQDLRRWYVPIQSCDCVIYGVVTAPLSRGRGFAPALLQWAAHLELTGGNHIFLDCKDWNLTAQRSFVKAGFRSIAVTTSPPSASVIGEGSYTI